MFGEWYERYVQRLKLRIVLTIMILFLVSLVMSCQELHYMISGKTVDASVNTHVEMRTTDDGQRYQQRILGYQWQDGDTQREEYVNVPMNWRGLASPTVKIEYIPGRNLSRMAGEHNYGWVTLFFVSLAATVGGLFWLGREK